MLDHEAHLGIADVYLAAMSSVSAVKLGRWLNEPDHALNIAATYPLNKGETLEVPPCNAELLVYTVNENNAETWKLHLMCMSSRKRARASLDRL